MGSKRTSLAKAAPFSQQSSGCLASLPLRQSNVWLPPASTNPPRQGNRVGKGRRKPLDRAGPAETVGGGPQTLGSKPGAPLLFSTQAPGWACHSTFNLSLSSQPTPQSGPLHCLSPSVRGPVTFVGAAAPPALAALQVRAGSLGKSRAGGTWRKVSSSELSGGQRKIKK